MPPFALRLAAALLVLGGLLAGPAHAAPGLQPPLTAAWTRALPYPVAHAADRGRLFVASSAADDAGECGTEVRALDPATGAVDWSSRGTPGETCAGGLLAATRGRVFAAAGGRLTALDADTGAVLWQRRLADDAPGIAPVAAGATVFTVVRTGISAGDEALLALDAATGEDRWRREVSLASYGGAPVAVQDGEVYLADSDCGLAALDAATGEERWARRFGCPYGGSDATAIVAGDTIVGWWSASGGHVVSRDTGVPARDFESYGPPAVAGGLLLTTSGHAVEGTELTTAAPRWRFEGEPAPRDPAIPTTWFDLPPGAQLLVAGATAYVADDQERLYGLDAASGELRWRARLPGLPGEPWYEETLLPLGAHDGTLLAVTDRRAVGLRPGRPEAEVLTGPAKTTASRRARFTFDAPGGAPTRCELDFGEEVPCSSPYHLRDLPAGAHAFRIRHVRAGDAAWHERWSVAWRWTVAAPPDEPGPRPVGPYPGWDATELVSQATGWGTQRGEGQSPVSSCTGRYVAFASAGGLVPDGGNYNHGEVYVRDLGTGITAVGSVGTTGTRTGEEFGAGEPSISADGRMLAFTSNDPDFSVENADEGQFTAAQVYVRDMVTGLTQLVSRADGAAGAPVADAAQTPSISADGRHVAFVTATRLDPADTDGADGREDPSVYVRDLLTDRTTLIDTGEYPALSGDGTRVAYARLYAEGDRPAGIYLRNRTTQTRTLVHGVARGLYARTPSLSRDGSRVAYEADVSAEERQVFERNLRTGLTTVVSRAHGAQGRAARGLEARASADGGKVLFWSDDVALDPLHEADPIDGLYGAWYVRDLKAGTTRLVSAGDGSDGLAGDSDWWYGASISGDGTAATFISDSEEVSGVPGEYGRYGVYARGIADRSAATAALCDEPYVGPPVDEDPPQTTLGPKPAPGERDVAITVSADESESAFDCRLDGAAWRPCGSPHRIYGLAAGHHELEARATDPAGNTDPTPALRAWETAAAAPKATPDTAIDTTLPAVSGGEPVEIEFSSAAADAIFACRLDDAAWRRCESPVRLPALADGPHAFEVRASTWADAVDGTPARVQWRVDATPPDTTIESAPAGQVASAAAEIRFIADDPDATFVCRLDGGDWAACAAPWTLSNLADGSHRAEVAAIDPAGRRDGSPAAVAWTVDTAAPDAAITAGPEARTTATSAEFTLASEPGARLEYALDGAAYTVAPGSRLRLSGLSAGPHALRVRARDAAGNTGPESEPWRWETLVPPPTPPSRPPSASPSPTPSSPAAERPSPFATQPLGPPAPTAPQSAAGAALARELAAVTRALERLGRRRLLRRKAVAPRVTVPGPGRLVMTVRAGGRRVAAGSATASAAGAVALRVPVRRAWRRAVARGRRVRYELAFTPRGGGEPIRVRAG